MRVGGARAFGDVMEESQGVLGWGGGGVYWFKAIRRLEEKQNWPVLLVLALLKHVRLCETETQLACQTPLILVLASFPQTHVAWRRASVLYCFFWAFCGPGPPITQAGNRKVFCKSCDPSYLRMISSTTAMLGIINTAAWPQNKWSCRFDGAENENILLVVFAWNHWFDKLVWSETKRGSFHKYIWAELVHSWNLGHFIGP